MGYRISKFEVDKLSRHAEIVPGYAFESERFTSNPSDIALVKGENVQQGFVDWEASKYWPAADADFYRKFELCAGDVVLAMDRPWVTAGLKWAYIKKHDPKSLLVQRVSRLRAKNDLDQTYLRYVISSRYFSNYIQPIVTGVNVPHISGKQIGDFKIPLPPLTIQGKIAAVLSAYDDLIENNKRRIMLLEKLAQEIYREWFVRFRFPGNEEVKIVKGVPSGWEVRTLGSLANEIKNGVRKKDLADDEKYIGLEHIPRRSIALKEWATAATVDSNKLLFQGRDILFGKIRPYLHKVALAHFAGACSSDTIVIRPKEKIYEGYLLFMIFSDTFIELATVASKGTKMPRADWGFLKKLELAVPSEKLLAKYQAQFDPLFSQIVNLLRANELLGIPRERLLPRLISGKLSVENLDIQFPPSMMEELKAATSAAAYA